MTTGTGRQDLRERFGSASESPSTSRHLRLYLPNPGVKPEARPRSRVLLLAEPALKFATRRMKVRTILVNEVSKASRSGIRVANSLSVSLASDSEDEREPRERGGGGPEGTHPDVEG